MRRRADVIRETLKRLRPYLGGRASQLYGVVLLAVISGLSEAAALLLAVRAAVDIGSVTTTIGSVSLSTRDSLLIAAAAELVALVTHGLIARGVSAIEATVLIQSRKVALARYIRAPWSAQAMQREGALQELVTTLSFRTSELAQSLARGLSQAVMLAMFVGAAVAVDWRFTLAIITVGALVVLSIRPLTRATRVRAKQFVDANSYYAEEVGRLASATMELKSFGVGEKAEVSIDCINSEAGERQYLARFSSLFVSTLFRDLAVFLLIGSIGVLHALGEGAMASAGVVIALIIRGLASAQQASATYQNISEMVPNLTAFNERLDRLVQDPEPSSPVRIDSFRSIDLRDVGYRYDESEPDALRGVDLSIRAGEFVGIVGPSGGGKSTLLQLILRLRHPSDGLIEVNGVDYARIPSDQWHHLVSFVPQEPSLLEATIAENISYYRDIPIENIHRVAKAANIFDEILELPRGFDTKLGPRGAGLSGGQKQRMAIARALAGEPSLLVMDEPTSALDTVSEAAVLDTIMDLKGSTTMILVAHRLSTVERCDYLVRVSAGEVTLGP